MVDALHELDYTGHVIPHNWWRHPWLQRIEKGRVRGIGAYTNAVVVLSDIVFFHRPLPIIDPVTNELKELRIRFTTERFPFSYSAKAGALGMTVEMVRDAVGFLHERCIIERIVKRPTNEVFTTPYPEIIMLLNRGEVAERPGFQLGPDGVLKRVGSASNPSRMNLQVEPESASNLIPQEVEVDAAPVVSRHDKSTRQSQKSKSQQQEHAEIETTVVVDHVLWSKLDVATQGAILGEALNRQMAGAEVTVAEIAARIVDEKLR